MGWYLFLSKHTDVAIVDFFKRLPFHRCLYLQDSKQDTALVFISQFFLIDILFSCYLPSFPAFLFCPDPLPCFGKRIGGSWMKTGGHASPQLANMGEAAWPFVNPDAALARSGQLFSCSWCVLHPARLSLAVCLTHYSHCGGTHNHPHTHLLLWFCLTRLSRSTQTGVPPCYSRYRSCYYAFGEFWIVLCPKKHFCVTV